MHAVTMQELLAPFTAAANKQTNLLDVGCGKGYSTLAYSILAGQLGLNYAMTGLDYHHSYMEKAYLNLDQYKQHLAGGQVKFTALDVINEQISGKHDVVTFGFEVSLDILKKQ
jgi:2-polyprenyl-3-methyl-5-hydroxy-6-metoxy-1,4-benzoquinol methylase